MKKVAMKKASVRMPKAKAPAEVKPPKSSFTTKTAKAAKKVASQQRKRMKY